MLKLLGTYSSLNNSMEENNEPVQVAVSTTDTLHRQTPTRLLDAIQQLHNVVPAAQPWQIEKMMRGPHINIFSA